MLLVSKKCILLGDIADVALVLAQYLYKIAGSTPSAWEQKGVAVAAYTVAVGCKCSLLKSISTTLMQS